MNPAKLDDRQNHLRDVARPGRLAKVWSRIRRLTTPGVTQANISPTSLNSLLIPFPSLSPQRAMAATLTEANSFGEMGIEDRRPDGSKLYETSLTKDLSKTEKARVKYSK